MPTARPRAHQVRAPALSRPRTRPCHCHCAASATPQDGGGSSAWWRGFAGWGYLSRTHTRTHTHTHTHAHARAGAASMAAGVKAMQGKGVEAPPKNMSWRVGGAAGADGKDAKELADAYSKAQSASGACPSSLTPTHAPCLPLLCQCDAPRRRRQQRLCGVVLRALVSLSHAHTHTRTRAFCWRCSIKRRAGDQGGGGDSSSSQRPARRGCRD